jgi:hypothetical protein
MGNTSFVDSIPLWGVYVLTFLLLLLAIELGYRYGVYRQKKNPTDNDAGMDTMVGASLALLGFLVAFVVSIAVGRFDHRRELVLAEATAIRTAYLQAGFVGEPYTTQTRDLLREFTGLNVLAAQTGDLATILPKAENNLEQLWSVTENAVKANPGRDEIALFADSVSQVISVHTARLTAALASRLPSTIILVLYLVAVLSMMIVGYHQSFSGKRNLIGILVMVLIFTVSILVIIDLDRPLEGFLQVNQQAMLNLQRLIGQ